MHDGRDSGATSCAFLVAKVGRTEGGVKGGLRGSVGKRRGGAGEKGRGSQSTRAFWLKRRRNSCLDSISSSSEVSWKVELDFVSFFCFALTFSLLKSSLRLGTSGPFGEDGA